MYKLIALYRQPSDPVAFEMHYHDVHLPLVNKLPGLTRTVINRGVIPPWGGEFAFYLVAEMYFPDEAAFLLAMNSPENRAAGKDLRGFAGDLVTLVTVKEDRS